LIWKFYKAHGRHELPWRKTTDAYKILVSEVMLQQTQVERVIPYYQNFLKKFPTVRSLANAPLSEVLIAWQGLGYNRRAKMLHLAAKEVLEKYKGKFPASVEALESLPGIGPYTARAVAAFAYNQDVVFIETNLRTVITHHFFKDREQISDKEILGILAQVFPKSTADRDSREWYAALMDYGSHLKRTGVHINAKSKTYTKQSKFAGSDREARGAILKALAKGPQAKSYLVGILGDDRKEQIGTQLEKLLQENLIKSIRSRFTLFD
jgi:A/G-specific adenine glycosylase